MTRIERRAALRSMLASATGGPGQPAPMIETNNVLSNPSGPEYQFLVGEGEPPRNPPRSAPLLSAPSRG